MPTRRQAIDKAMAQEKIRAGFPVYRLKEPALAEESGGK
jgi:hypothetical protein